MTKTGLNARLRNPLSASKLKKTTMADLSHVALGSILVRRISH